MVYQAKPQRGGRSIPVNTNNPPQDPPPPPPSVSKISKPVKVITIPKVKTTQKKSIPVPKKQVVVTQTSQLTWLNRIISKIRRIFSWSKK